MADACAGSGVRAQVHVGNRISGSQNAIIAVVGVLDRAPIRWTWLGSKAHERCAIKWVISEGDDFSAPVCVLGQISRKVVLIEFLPLKWISHSDNPIRIVVNIASHQAGSLLRGILHAEKIAIGIVGERRHSVLRPAWIGHLKDLIQSVILI